MTTVSPESMKVIADDAAAAYPEECCGFLFGEFEPAQTQVKAALAAGNSRASMRESRFVITPEDFIEAEKAANSLGMEVVGFYHSHPDCPAEPSRYDLEHALPVYAYLIAGVACGEVIELRSWILSDDRTAFREEEVKLEEK